MNKKFFFLLFLVSRASLSMDHNSHLSRSFIVAYSPADPVRLVDECIQLSKESCNNKALCDQHLIKKLRATSFAQLVNVLQVSAHLDYEGEIENCAARVIMEQIPQIISNSRLQAPLKHLSLQQFALLHQHTGKAHIIARKPTGSIHKGAFDKYNRFYRSSPYEGLMRDECVSGRTEIKLNDTKRLRTNTLWASSPSRELFLVEIKKHTSMNFKNPLIEQEFFLWNAMREEKDSELLNEPQFNNNFFDASVSDIGDIFLLLRNSHVIKYISRNSEESISIKVDQDFDPTIAFLTDAEGKLIFGGEDQGNIKIIDSSNGKQMSLFQHGSSLNDMKYCADNILCTGANKTSLYSLETGQSIYTQEHDVDMKAAALNRPTNLLVTTYQGKIFIWDIRMLEQVKTVSDFYPYTSYNYQKLDISPNSCFLAATERFNDVHIFKLHDSAEELRIAQEIAESPNGSHALNKMLSIYEHS